MREPYYVYSTKVSPQNQGVFPLLEDVTLCLLCHSSTASICGSFARQSSALSGLFQASYSSIRFFHDSKVCGWVSPSLRRRPSTASGNRITLRNRVRLCFLAAMRSVFAEFSSIHPRGHWHAMMQGSLRPQH